MRIVIIIALSLFIAGCTQQSRNETLTQAERLIFENPDSVVRMLSPCWADSTMSEPDKALFGLLYTESLHRSGLSTEADSLIIFSKNYYEANDDKEHLARALLHHAIILYKQQNTHEAVLTMKRAESIAENLDSHGFKWYLYLVLGDINDNVGNYTQTLRYYKQALEEARQYDNKEWIVRALNNIAMTFDMIGERDSMLHYTQQATPYAQDTKGEVRATYFVNLASSKKAAGKQKEAKEYLQKALSSFPTDRGMQLLADIYMEEGDTIAAKEMWYRLTNSFSPDVSIQSYRMLIMYLKQRGDLKGVAEYSQRLNEVYNSLYERNDAAGIIELQKEYDEQREELHQYRLTIALLSAIILLIVAAIVFIRYSRKRIDTLNAQFAESQQQYNLTRSELTSMRKQKEREQKENSRQMKEVLSRLHNAASKGKSASDEDINNLAQLSYAQSPKLHSMLSSLNAKEQMICLLTRHSFLPTEIAILTISTPQAITNTRVRLLKKLFNLTGGAKDFDTAIKKTY